MSDTYQHCRHCRHRDHSRAPRGHFTPCLHRPSCRGSRFMTDPPMLMRLAMLLNLFPVR